MFKVRRAEGPEQNSEMFRKLVRYSQRNLRRKTQGKEEKVGESFKKRKGSNPECC